MSLMPCTLKYLPEIKFLNCLKSCQLPCVGAGTQVLRKSNKCSLLLSHLTSFKFCLKIYISHIVI